MTTESAQRIAKGINQALMVEDVLDDILLVIGENAEPEDVFDKDTLSEWAENNGYVKAE